MAPQLTWTSPVWTLANRGTSVKEQVGTPKRQRCWVLNSRFKMMRHVAELLWCKFTISQHIFLGINEQWMLLNWISPDDDGHDYDSALDLTGYGRFHYWLAFICGWANASDAVEILCISFLLPSAGDASDQIAKSCFINWFLYFAECDLELTPARKGWLSAILFVGMMIGCPNVNLTNTFGISFFRDCLTMSLMKLIGIVI